MIAEGHPLTNGAAWTPPAPPPEGARDARLDCLQDVAQVVNSSLDLDVVIDRILEHAVRILEAESGSLMLREDSGRLRVLAARGPRSEYKLGREQELGVGVAGWVALHGEPLLLHGEVSEREFRTAFARRDVRDALCVPLKTGDYVLGVLNLSNRLRAEPFDAADLRLLTALADHTAVAMRNARAYEELRRQHKTLQLLLEEVTHAQEEERLRIALQVQEGPGQVLAAALERIQEQRPQMEDGVTDPKSVLLEAEQALHRAVEEIRMVALDLQPPRLDGLGLDGALQLYATQFEQRTGIRTRLESGGQGARLPHAVEACFYRIAQEALTSIWKHTHSRQVWLTLESGGRSCMLEVRDDGCGIARTGRSPLDDLNPDLMSIRERAGLVGARVSVHSGPNQSTALRVTAPLSP